MVVNGAARLIIGGALLVVAVWTAMQAADRLVMAIARHWCGLVFGG